MAAWLDGCRFTPTLGGTTDWTYSAVVTGYQSPAAANVVNGRLYKYRAESADLSQWEFGEGAYNTATGVLARTTVLYNSLGTTSKIGFSTVPQVAIVALKEDLISIEESNSFTSTQQAQARSNIYAAPFDALAYNGMQVNGGFEVDQVNVGAAVAFGSGSNNLYVVDGWSIVKQGTNAFTAQQAASVFPGYNNELKITITTAESTIGSDFILLDHCIEGYKIARAGWGTANAQPVTVGFWVKSSVAGTVNLTMFNNGQTSSSSTTGAIAAANTAQWVTATFPAVTTGTWLTTNGLGFRFRVALAQASNINIAATNGNTFEITGVILLPGVELPASSRAPLIMRPFDQELLLCQRYFEKTYDYATALGTVTNNGAQIPGVYQATSAIFNLAGGSFRMAVRKRNASYTITPYSPVTGASGKIRDVGNGVDITPTLDYTGEASFRWFSSITANAVGELAGHFTIDNRL